MDAFQWFLIHGPIAWVRRRNWRLVAQGCPAVLAAVGFLAAVAAGDGADDRVRRHLISAQAANRAGNSAAALSHAEAAARGRPDDPATRFELALAAAGTGDHPRAAALLNELAPPDRKGYPPAHFAMARGILAQPASSPDLLRAAEAHLLRADEAADVPKDELNLLLGEVYLMTGRPAEATARLKAAGSLMPARLRLGQLAAGRGEEGTARIEGEACRHFFAARLQADPTNRTFRLFLIDSHVLLGQFQDALATIDGGLALAPNDPQLRATRGEVYGQWLLALDRKPGTPPDAKLRVLEQGLIAEPTSPPLLLRLWSFAEAKGPKADEAQALLRTHLASGRNPAITHFILGTTAWQAGKTDEAVLHLEQAYKADGKIPVIGNNLAWVLADRKPPQLDRALEVIDAVLVKFPANPRYRGTRGHILVKMGRWKEALPELESSLSLPDVTANAHVSLAEVYRHLGDKAMAEEHSNKARALPRSPPPRPDLSPR